MYEDYINKYDVAMETIRHLYNPDQKLKFIKDVYGHQNKDAIKAQIGFWGRIGKDIESPNNKDIIKSNIAEFYDAFDELDITSKGTFSIYKSSIRSYFEWGVQNGLFKIDDISKYFDDLYFENTLNDDRIKRKYFGSFKDLQKGIRVLLEYDDTLEYSKYDHDAVILVAYFLWCGLLIDQIYRLEVKSIDLKSNIINTDGRQYFLNDEISAFIADYLDKTSYMMRTKVSGNRKYFYKQTGYLFRVRGATKISHPAKGTLITDFSNFGIESKGLDQNNDFYDHLFRMKNISDSGFFDRIYSYEQTNRVSVDYIDTEQFLSLFYDSKVTPQRKLYLLDMYKRWKRLFYGI